MTDQQIDEKYRNKPDDIKIGSVWQLLSSERLCVIESIDDGWVVKQYVGDHGMKRTGAMDIPQFLSFYRLFYTPDKSNKPT
ncbi:hypothetical protein [Psychrobacter sp. I-STPA6b]|uniref:hypothetical protein n=1 Tax=Psychrobacter sp. I-STPA6b TaxID=2585718 RepID=UPI001D0CBBEB|nr:hypothetical protein [Psychrobacter sp. I-STPA6b]